MNAATCLSLDTAREECEFAVSHGILLDPFNESPYRYLIGIIKEQRGNGEVSHEEYYAFVDEGLESINPSIIQGVLEQGNVMQDNVNSCFNWTSARIDLLELKGDPTSLELVRFCSRFRVLLTTRIILRFLVHDTIISVLT